MKAHQMAKSHVIKKAAHFKKSILEFNAFVKTPIIKTNPIGLSLVI
jgi:hypothetical protein